GDKVEAQYKGKSKFYPGVNLALRLNGTYDIDYDDGEKETGVAGRADRSLGKKAAGDSDDDPKAQEGLRRATRAAATVTTTRSTQKFKEGDKVEAQYKGKSKFYPGVISRCRLNGTYDIDYDDGEKETGGGSVQGQEQILPGVISRCRLNGTYDIDYDDGEKETGVAAELIRSLGKKGGGDSDDDPKHKKFKEGDKVEAQYKGKEQILPGRDLALPAERHVEAQYKGKSKFYPGVISRCRLNGTYDIDYDDGEKETGVAAELIRSLGKKGGGDSDDDPKHKKFKEGDKVEAQYKGKSKFYPGETGVAAELIRSLGKKGGGDSDDDPKHKKFKEGDKVEAQYKGKKQILPGRDLALPAERHVRHRLRRRREGNGCGGRADPVAGQEGRRRQ
ncbi:hypothetical protein Pcac1_g24293, partial [Phytophthora cactorum]